jgi:hypothetical protein
MLCLLWCVLALVLSLGSLAWAEDPRFADCGPGRVFVWTCEDEEPVPIVVPPSPTPPPPLFTPQTVAPTAPPALLEGLNNPTPETAARYVDDQQARLQTIFAFDKLVKDEYRRRGVGRPQPSKSP